MIAPAYPNFFMILGNQNESLTLFQLVAESLTSHNLIEFRVNKRKNLRNETVNLKKRWTLFAFRNKRHPYSK